MDEYDWRPEIAPNCLNTQKFPALTFQAQSYTIGRVSRSRNQKPDCEVKNVLETFALIVEQTGPSGTIVQIGL